MRAKRTEKVADLFRKEISDLILKEVKDPRIGFVTVTDVEISKDLKHARVYVSVMEQDTEKRKETLTALNRASGFLRHRMYKNLSLRYSPELKFFLDESIDKGFRIDEVLKELDVRLTDEEEPDARKDDEEMKDRKHDDGEEQDRERADDEEE